VDILEFKTQEGQENFLLFKMSRPDWGHTETPIQ